MPRSEPRLAADGGNARTPTEPPGGAAAPEQGLDSGDELRGLRVDDDVTAEQHPADHLPGDWDATWRLAELLAERGELDGPCRYCAPKPTPATGTPPGGWPSC